MNEKSIELLSDAIKAYEKYSGVVDDYVSSLSEDEKADIVIWCLQNEHKQFILDNRGNEDFPYSISWLLIQQEYFNVNESLLYSKVWQLIKQGPLKETK